MFSFNKKKRRRKRNRKISLVWFTIKHLLLRISKYCIRLLLFLLIVFLILLRFNRDFKISLLNHPIPKQIKQILKRSCYNIKIEGVQNVDVAKINFYIGEYCSPTAKDSYTLNTLKQNITKDPWIKNVSIRKELPNTLRVVIEEHTPFAMWKNKNKLHLINEAGDIIKISKNEQKRFYNLLIITGQGSKKNIKTLLNILLPKPELTSRIKIANRISNRRWDLIFDNNVLTKLPEDKFLSRSWDRLIRLLSTRGIEIGLKTIDLRVEDRVYLEYERKELKEIKKI